MHHEFKECRSDWDHYVQPGSPEDECWTDKRGLKGELEKLNHGVESLATGLEVKFARPWGYDP